MQTLEDFSSLGAEALQKGTRQDWRLTPRVMPHPVRTLRPQQLPTAGPACLPLLLRPQGCLGATERHLRRGGPFPTGLGKNC